MYPIITLLICCFIHETNSLVWQPLSFSLGWASLEMKLLLLQLLLLLLRLIFLLLEVSWLNYNRGTIFAKNFFAALINICFIKMLLLTLIMIVKELLVCICCERCHWFLFNNNIISILMPLVCLNLIYFNTISSLLEANFCSEIASIF